jgi:hypothetical protein
VTRTAVATGDGERWRWWQCWQCGWLFIHGRHLAGHLVDYHGAGR